METLLVRFFRRGRDGTLRPVGDAAFDGRAPGWVIVPPADLDPRLLSEATVQLYRDNVGFGSLALEGEEYCWQEVSG
ncbi:MAG TPA: hypothetical protein VFE78_31560 [Gemmataceae bacterium]|jgi:hypothetical protein|nr:hypothetical protein [Gemmataceae bacterium]